MKTLYKKVERWFYLQLELMLNMYKRRGNPMFTYEETHKPNEFKNIAKFDIKNKDNKITESNIRYWRGKCYWND